MFLKDKANINVATAATLTTARAINGTSFNGSADITTANWGTPRTLTIGSTGKSVNGSTNISWSLSEIGAAASSHTHSYLPLSGGTLTGSIKSSMTTGTYLAGNQGNALLASTNTAGAYTTLIRSVSANGYFTINNYNNNFILGYTAKTTVDAGTNGLTKQAVLMNEAGNSEFPGSVTAASFLGAGSINLCRRDTYLGQLSGSQTCDTLRLGSNIIAADSGKALHVIDSTGAAATIYTSNIYPEGNIQINKNKKTTYYAIDVMRKCDSNTLSGYTHSTARFGCTNSWGGAATIEYRENDSTKNQIEIHDNFIRMNGYPVFIQSGTPSITTGSSTVTMPTGSIWIQI